MKKNFFTFHKLLFIFFINLFCIIAYVVIGLYNEEKILVKVFKNQYIDYQKNTYRYFPFLR